MGRLFPVLVLRSASRVGSDISWAAALEFVKGLSRYLPGNIVDCYAFEHGLGFSHRRSGHYSRRDTELERSVSLASSSVFQHGVAESGAARVPISNPYVISRPHFTKTDGDAVFGLGPGAARSRSGRKSDELSHIY